MKKVVKLGDVKIVETKDNLFVSSIEIDEKDYETYTQDISEGLGFILKTLTEQCSGRDIEENGKPKHDSYSLSIGITDDGYYEIIATACKSKFILLVKKKDDVVKVLEAVDLRFPRYPLREFIGESAREVLRCVKTDSF
ncbi:MAG: hypothetical protein GXY08_07160 [Ruminococcus sp.]|jgi:hypothetical protein|nr:hypothetical protein [Ruminococcus flavefaciens]NLT09266.1 hypothetical protein [Ruminococcus sp.]